MLLIGTVLKTERIVGKTDDGSRSWDFTQVHVWDGDTLHVTMIGREFGDIPGQGEDLVAAVAVNPRRNSRSGAYENSVTLLRRVTAEQLLDALPTTAARAA